MFKGDIKSYFDDRVVVDKATGCWNWKLRVDGDGYGRIGLRQYRNQRTHRVAYLVFKGEIPDGLLVMHSCDNRRCCNPAHLSVGTNMENMADSKNKGRGGAYWFRGEENPKSTLCAASVRRIREMAAAGAKSKDIAKAVGCGRTMARLVADGKRWAHVI